MWNFTSYHNYIVSTTNKTFGVKKCRNYLCPVTDFQTFFNHSTSAFRIHLFFFHFTFLIIFLFGLFFFFLLSEYSFLLYFFTWGLDNIFPLIIFVCSFFLLFFSPFHYFFHSLQPRRYEYPS